MLVCPKSQNSITLQDKQTLALHHITKHLPSLEEDKEKEKTAHSGYEAYCSFWL